MGRKGGKKYRREIRKEQSERYKDELFWKLGKQVYFLLYLCHCYYYIINYCIIYIKSINFNYIHILLNILAK